MITIVCIFILLVLLHFIYQGILLASFRLKLRFNLFELRDRLRMLKYSNREKIDDKTFKYMQEIINTTIRFLHYIDIVNIIGASNTLKEDKNLRKRIEKINAVLDQCKFEDFQRIREQQIITTFYALLANNGAWFIYIIPIVLPFLFFKKIISIAKNVVSIPEENLEDIILEEKLSRT